MALVSGNIAGISVSTNVNIRSSVGQYPVLYTTTTDASGNWSKVLPVGTYIFCSEDVKKECVPNVVATSIPKTGVNLTKGSVDEPQPLGDPDGKPLPKGKGVAYPSAFRVLALYRSMGANIDTKELRKLLNKTPHITWCTAYSEDTYHNDNLVQDDAADLWVVLFWDAAGDPPDLTKLGIVRLPTLMKKPGKKSAPKKAAPKKK